MVDALHPDYFKWLLDTLYNERGVAPFNPGIQQFPGNINEVTPNASNIPPKGTPSWTTLLGDQKIPFPANKNIPGGSLAPAPVQAAAPAPTGAPEPGPSLSGGASPSVIGTTLNTASRFLPPWAQAGIAAGRVMWPTPTAPPSMDEAPQWSWPRQ